VAAIFGANASGKSNLLEGVRFFKSAVKDSHSRWTPNQEIPRKSFCLDSESLTRPTLFEADFVVDGIRTQYGFEVSNTRFLSEWLFQFPHGRPRRIFEREGQDFKFGETLSGQKRLTADITRTNSLFLSAAATANHASLKRVFDWFDKCLSVVYPRQEDPASAFVTVRLLKEATSAKQVNALLKMADLGIVSALVEARQIGTEQAAIAERMLASTTESEESAERLLRQLRQSMESLEAVRMSHVSASGETYINFEDESLGTRTWFNLIGHLVLALQRGSTLFVDELDASLHPVLISETVRLFEDPRANRRGAQLVFTSHDTTPLGRMAGFPLKRDQVWLVEKSAHGASSLFPITDYKPRKGENLQVGYLQGRYGAVPRPAWFELLHSRPSIG
jgi:AAA15 family ATPase/GTPase